MEVVYEQRFLKDVEKIKDGKILKRSKAKLEEVEKIVDAHEDNGEAPEIPGMTKLQGHDHYDPRGVRQLSATKNAGASPRFDGRL